ncbi:MAG: hypothetical protein LBB67_03380 [Oscillospiraceae bacterium]|nr:hypothetical protein [Oscillospiraceae bacterium]
MARCIKRQLKQSGKKILAALRNEGDGLARPVIVRNRVRHPSRGVRGARSS